MWSCALRAASAGNVGASHLIVHSGDVIAFAFGDGTAPEAVTFEEICGTQ